MKMKMKYTEQAVETLDDAGSVIANKNIEIEQLRQRVQELEKERDAAWKEAVEHVEAQQNIINELTTERNELRARLLQKMDDCVKAEKQNEQLRQRVAELEKERDRLSGLCDKWNFECDEMREDNKRLANVADVLMKQRDELVAAMIHIQQVACSGSPELGIATNAIASVKEKA